MSENGSNGTWNVSISGWTYGDVMDYQTVAKSNNLKELTEWVVKRQIIKSWEHPGDPCDFEAWEKLPPKAGPEALKRVDQTVASIFQDEK